MKSFTLARSQAAAEHCQEMMAEPQGLSVSAAFFQGSGTLFEKTSLLLSRFGTRSRSAPCSSKAHGTQSIAVRFASAIFSSCATAVCQILSDNFTGLKDTLTALGCLPGSAFYFRYSAWGPLVYLLSQTACPF